MPNLPSSKICISDLRHGKYFSCCENRGESKKNSRCDKRLSSHKTEKKCQVNICTYVCSEVKSIGEKSVIIVPKIESKLTSNISN